MTSTELGYLSGVTSNIQDQLNGKAGRANWSVSSVTGNGWKQILSWKNTGSFIVSIWNNYNYQKTNCITLLVTTGYNTARLRLLNTANRSDEDSNNVIENAGICNIGDKITLNVLLSQNFNNNLYIDVLSLGGSHTDVVLDYDSNPSMDSGYIDFLHNFVGSYLPVKTECAIFGSTLPETNTNKYESGWYAGQIFFLKST